MHVAHEALAKIAAVGGGAPRPNKIQHMLPVERGPANLEKRHRSIGNLAQQQRIVIVEKRIGSDLVGFHKLHLPARPEKSLLPVKLLEAMATGVEPESVG